MIIRHRAMQAEDKQERYNAILDAAERVLLRGPELEANMAAVAVEAGLAKGTVYLYFPSKEELLLALHERNIAAFFNALNARLDAPLPMAIDDVLHLTHRYMIDPPIFLPMAARCLSHMASAIPEQASLAFKQRLGERMGRAGAGLEKHFAQLPAGGGVTLLRHSYSLILGLWQLSGAESSPCVEPADSPLPPWSYAQSLDAALRALWSGTVLNLSLAAPAAGSHEPNTPAPAPAAGALTPL